MRSSASCAVPLLEDQKRASPEVNCPAAPRLKKAASSWMLSQPEEKSLNTSALVLPASRKTKLSWPPPPPTLSLPAPPSSQSVPSLPNTKSFPAPPSTESLPPEPWRRSLPPSPLMVSVLVVPTSVSLPAVPLIVAMPPPAKVWSSDRSVGAAGGRVDSPSSSDHRDIRRRNCGISGDRGNELRRPAPAAVSVVIELAARRVVE